MAIDNPPVTPTRPFFEYIKHLKITDRAGLPLGSWNLNTAQKAIYKKIIEPTDTEEDYRERRALPKAIILKARALGCSAMIQGYKWMLANRFGYSCLTAAQDDGATKGLFDRYSRRWYFNEMKERTKGKKVVKDRYRWDTQRSLELESAGRIMLLTAGSREGGHSHTFQFLHLSEASRYPNAYTFLKGVMGAASHAGVIIESTANGMTGDGEWFYKFWQESRAGLTGYVPIFLPWYIEPAYSIPGDHWQAPVTSENLDDDEKELVETKRLTFQQLAWRRQRIQEPDIHGDVNVFKEQYPSFPAEAFMFSGQPFFDRVKAKALLESTQHTAGRKDGFTTVWEQPKKFHEYVIAVDVGEGIGRDPSAVQILTATEPPRQVLEWESPSVDPVTLGVIVAQYSRIYNNALVCVEINNHGLTTQQKLIDIGGIRFYLRRQWDHTGKEYLDRPGWKTTHSTKDLMLDYARIRLINGTTGIRSNRLAEQIVAYIRAQDSHFQQSHFDLLIAYCMGLMAIEQRGLQAPLPQARKDLGPVEMYREMQKRKSRENAIWTP